MGHKTSVPIDGYQERRSFFSAFFADDPSFFPSFMETISSTSMLDWATVVVCSESVQRYLRGEKTRQKMNDTHQQQMVKFLLEEPLVKIYWKERVPMRISEYYNSMSFGNDNSWINPVAALVCLTRKRILCGIPLQFNDVRKRLLSNFQGREAKISDVLNFTASSFGIECRQITPEEASLSVFNGRPCLVNIHLESKQFKNLSDFFSNQSNRNKAINVLQLKAYRKEKDLKALGFHECDFIAILLDTTDESFVFMSQNGSSWGDNGKFMVEKGAIGMDKMTFYDFYSREEFEQHINSTYSARLKYAEEWFYRILDSVHKKKKDHVEDLTSVFQKRNELSNVIRSNLLNVLEGKSLSVDEIGSVLLGNQGKSIQDIEKLMNDALCNMDAIIGKNGGVNRINDIAFIIEFTSTLCTIIDVRNQLDRLCADFWREKPSNTK